MNPLILAIVLTVLGAVVPGFDGRPVEVTVVGEVGGTTSAPANASMTASVRGPFITPDPILVPFELSQFMPLPEEAVYGLVDEYGGPPEMVPVAHCESRFIADVVNEESGASGPWQFMPGTWEAVRESIPEIGPYSNAHDWHKSTQAAVWLWLNDGPQHWSCW